jgi:hypothetical protein
MPSTNLLKTLYRFRKLVALYVVAETVYKLINRTRRKHP